jgi:nitrilase
VKVAAAQVRAPWLDKDASTKVVIDVLQRAARLGVEVVAFPETFLSGYPFWVCRTGGARFEDAQQKRAYAFYLEAAVEVDGPEVETITEAVADLGLFTFLGMSERGVADGRGTVWCTLLAIDGRRGVVGSHRKLVPTHDERLVWGRGDGAGLRSHPVGGFRVSGLNCWENWMPEARAALYADGTDLHVGVWPGSSTLTEDITRFIALEGRVWSMAVSGLATLADVPTDFPLYDELRALPADLPFDGGSGVVGPDGQWVAGPVRAREALVVAEIDHELLRRERLSVDRSGHYCRPDVLSLTVDRRRQRPVYFVDDETPGRAVSSESR